MIVKLEGKLERGFAPWKAMVEGASDKLKEHGMTIIFAGTSAADDNSMTVIIDFASSEGMMNFANDEEAKKTREEAIAIYNNYNFNYNETKYFFDFLRNSSRGITR